jgi:IS30 family transposase|tara:strand:- start:93 stop:1235 length:1143 start_codon:yes stop_codon:yes gene_type:complete
MTKRPHMTTPDKALIWKRWHDGSSLSDIAREIGKSPPSVFGFLRQFGGIEPALRVRSERHLTLAEREEISRGLVAGDSIRGIARALSRSPSTISREINRNGTVRSYRATSAEAAAWRGGTRPKRCRLAALGRLRQRVITKLKLDWSPEQIAGWLQLTYPENDSMQVSHETIYKSLFIQSRGILKKELQKHLRRGRKFRQSRAGNRGGNRGQIIDGISIRERPAEVEDRALPGHWEGDLISGSNNSHIATVVERTTRFTVLVKVEGKDTKSVTTALTSQMRKLPDIIRQTLTWDRGMELADHKAFSLATDIDVYFCDPRSPWQRGTNENTNGLLRQYFPKGSDLSGYTQVDLNKVARRLNTRPRKTLGFHTPAQEFNVVLQ